MAKINLSKEFKTFIHGSMTSFVIIGFTGVLNLGIRLLLQHNLSEIDYGFFYSAIALILLILSFSDLGLGQAMTILTARANEKEDHNLLKEQFKNIIQLKFILATALSILLLIFSSLIVRYYLKYPSNYYVFLALIPAILIQSINGGYACYFNGLKMYKSAWIISFFTAFLWILGILGVLFLKEFHVLLISLSYVVALFIPLIAAVIYGYKQQQLKFNIFKKSGNYQSIIKFCGYLAVSTALLTSMYYLDTIMLTSLNGLASSAKYNTALPIMQIIQSFMIFVGVFTPIASGLWVKNDYQQLKKFANVALLLTFAILPFVYLFFSNFGGSLVKMLFSSQDYKQLGVTVTILCCGMLFFTFNNFLFQILNSGHCERKVANITVVGVVVNIILNYILIKNYDYNGAAMATAITYFIMSIFSYSTLKKRLKNHG